MLDTETLFTTIFVMVDDAYKNYRKIFADHSPGPQPTFSDAEVLTLALAEELLSKPAELRFHAWVRANYLHLFPRLIERSRYHRRRKQLLKPLAWIIQHLQQQLGVGDDPHQLVDSFPVRVCRFSRAKRCRNFVGEASLGYVASGKEVFYGFRMHLLTTFQGLPVGFGLASANVDDREAFEALAPLSAGKTVFADKGYVDAPLAQRLREQYGVDLRAIPRDNQKHNWPKATKQLVGRVRRLIESIISQLTRQFDISRTLAKAMPGLLVRLTSKIGAYLLGAWMNRQHGFPLRAMRNLGI